MNSTKAELITATDGKARRKRRNSNGNLVNVGNADSDGMNVNGNHPGNRNGNIGVALSLKSLLRLFGVFQAFYPTTEHAPDFMQFFLQSDVLFLVNRFSVV